MNAVNDETESLSFRTPERSPGILLPPHPPASSRNRAPIEARETATYSSRTQGKAKTIAASGHLQRAGFRAYPPKTANSAPSANTPKAASMPSSNPPCRASSTGVTARRIQGRRTMRAATTSKATPPATNAISRTLIAPSASSRSKIQYSGVISKSQTGW